MKKRNLSLLLVVLTCLSFVGIGFASWLILNPVKSESTGNITVETVSAESYTVTAQWYTDAACNNVAATPTIHFGGAVGRDTAANDWVKFSGNDQSLTLYLKVTVDGTLPGNGFDVSIAITDDANTDWADSVSANYVVAPTIKKGDDVKTTLASSDFTDVEGSLTQKYVILSVNFAWGSAFNSQNPEIYYNGQTRTDTLAAAAKTALEQIYKLSAVSYKVTVQGK